MRRVEATEQAQGSESLLSLWVLSVDWSRLFAKQNSALQFSSFQDRQP